MGISKNVQKSIDELKSFRDIGETFTYRGVELMVESHNDSNGETARIQAVYVTETGELKRFYFIESSLPLLHNEQEYNNEIPFGDDIFNLKYSKCGRLLSLMTNLYKDKSIISYIVYSMPAHRMIHLASYHSETTADIHSRFEEITFDEYDTP